ncbi:hypothetical protein PQX77_013528 [Marasmius sp. AFHP31]|nr:hypothetical protein PQX77_013528 [Marasmius sp. AFHP31]
MSGLTVIPGTPTRRGLRTPTTSPTKHKNRSMLATPQDRLARSIAKRQSALDEAEKALLVCEQDHQEARVRLQEAKQMYKDAAEQSAIAKANLRASNEDVSSRLLDLKDINDKMRRLLEMDALDEWTDSDGSNGNVESPTLSPTHTVQSSGGWTYDPAFANWGSGSAAGWGNGSGTWGEAREAHKSPPTAVAEVAVLSDSDDELGELSIQGPKTPQIQVEPGSKFPAYVVYYGKDCTHGLFTGWKSVVGRAGAKSLCTDESHIVKGFLDPKLAADHYNDFVNSDASKVLAHSPSEGERFIVVEGAKPGVYDDRRSLVIFGLQYRGGRVRRFIGGRGDAQAKFSQWKDKGFVKVTPSI